MAIQTATATFTGAEDSVTVAWTAMAGAFGIAASVTVSDALGPIAIALSARSSSGCTVTPSARFSGTVELVIFDTP